jgi:hypothetical protein
MADGAIRYLTIRADVLMGLAEEWPGGDAQQFVAALERSVLRHSRDSFVQYQSTGRLGGDDFLAAATEIAAQLGWGTWRIEAVDSVRRRIVVRSSPFAAGFGPSAHPVCGAICGALQAMVSVGYGRDVEVTETSCAAQSRGEECIFNAVLDPFRPDADGSQGRR